MKKCFLFASLIAMVAILATSCKPKGDVPTVRFGYEVNELTVTFTNLCKDATSYAWDFGDGATSTEEAPKHEYKDYGTYTVKLTAKNQYGDKSATEDVEIIKRIIAIDGDFSDWQALDAKVAKCAADENSKYDYFDNAKFVRDEDFVYFFLEFLPDKDDFSTEEEGDVHDYWVKHISLWLNLDDQTGCDIWWWAPGAHVDFLIEGSWEDKFESAAIDQCPEDLNGGDNAEWQWVSTGITGAVSSCEAVDLANGHKAIEGKIMVKLLPIEAVTVKMGIGALAPDWENYAGELPQVTMNDDGTTSAGALMEVPLIK